MLDVFNTSQPTGCNIQTFYGQSGTIAASQVFSWAKPRGVSHVYMLLIGGGGPGNASTVGGGSGAISVWYGAAQNVPDLLRVQPGRRSAQSTIYPYYSASITLISAPGTTSSNGGVVSSANAFTASGFYQSVEGQNGNSVDNTPSSTTFLSGGAASGNTVTANYGYKIGANGNGFFLTQPIIVGVGAAGGSRGGFGCGGGVTGLGGPGLILIASW